MKHGVSKQAANELALKDVDKELFDQRISPAVVTISDEDGEIDIFGEIGHMTWRFLRTTLFDEGNVFSSSTRIGGVNARAPC